MKQRTLLLFLTIVSVTIASAQKKQQNVTGYAITGLQKGNHSWKEVRLVDVKSGDELQTVYSSKTEMPVLNARTGKPVAKKDVTSNLNAPRVVNGKKVVSLDEEIGNRTSFTSGVIVEQKAAKEKEIQSVRTTVPMESFTRDGKTVYVYQSSGFARVSSDKPFATTSAAMAYDKKHDRLYYTPMNINQLRYIDLKSKTPSVYFFEDEAFGTMAPGVDMGKQITRMVIASDGNGYALTNDANSLIRFTTGKNPEITDLGALTDEAGNVKSVHSRGGYGGDLIADKSGNLYLITANRNVYKFSIEAKVAKHLGTIKGLPQGFQTNGAMVEEGSKVIVCSSESTEGYFRFDLVTLDAEKASSGTQVFNASDLANGNLAFAKKEKEKKEKKEKPEVVAETKAPTPVEEAVANKKDPVSLNTNGISVYPNPVTDGFVKLAFTDQPAGLYQVHFLDLSGRIISTQQVTINSRNQIAEFRLPQLVSAGTYYVKIFSEANKVSSLTKLVVQ